LECVDPRRGKPIPRDERGGDAGVAATDTSVSTAASQSIPRAIRCGAMSDFRIEPIPAPFRATLSPPGSKSLTNRALILAALADGVCDLSNVLFADDTHVMLENLMRLGFHLVIDHDAAA